MERTSRYLHILGEMKKNKDEFGNVFLEQKIRNVGEFFGKKFNVSTDREQLKKLLKELQRTVSESRKGNPSNFEAQIDIESMPSLDTSEDVMEDWVDRQTELLASTWDTSKKSYQAKGRDINNPLSNRIDKQLGRRSVRPQQATEMSLSSDSFAPGIYTLPDGRRVNIKNENAFNSVKKAYGM